MKVAVCCPGPSLPRRWAGRAGFDLVVAVNRAMITVPDADWLSAGDIGFYESLLPASARPRIGVVTMDGHLPRIAADPTWTGRALVGWDAVPLIAEHARRGRALAWSVQVALCQAAHLGARHVDLVGCDGAAGGQVEDCTGYPGESRGADRWAREEIDLALTFTLLSELGVAVRRIEP